MTTSSPPDVPEAADAEAIFTAAAHLSRSEIWIKIL
jgi:hypothetical protein